MSAEKKKKIVIIGAGEFAEIAYEYFTYDSEYEVAGFSVEQEYRKTDLLFNLPVIDLSDIQRKFPSSTHEAFVAVTFTQLNRVRARLYCEMKEMGYRLANYVSSKAFIWHNVKLGENVFVFENNVLQYNVEIGNNVVLWSGNHVGHRSKIGDNTFLSSHVVVSGYCEIGRNCFFGVNSCIGDTLKIADDNVIGAGAVVVRSSEADCVLVGNPAKPTGHSAKAKFKVEELTQY